MNSIAENACTHILFGQEKTNKHETAYIPYHSPEQSQSSFYYDFRKKPDFPYFSISAYSYWIGNIVVTSFKISIKYILKNDLQKKYLVLKSLYYQI